MLPYRCETLAVAAPRCVELDKVAALGNVVLEVGFGQLVETLLGFGRLGNLCLLQDKKE